jgi:hypothetical protein
VIVLPSRIALTGVIGSGKSTLGDALARRFGIKAVAFADPLKCAVQAALGISTEDLWGPTHTRDNLYKEFPTSGWCFDCAGYCQGPERELSLFKLDDDEEVARVRKAAEDRLDYWLCPGCHATYPGFVNAREALKTLGTNWGRTYSTEMWVRRTFTAMSEHESYVITDCRFHNERRLARKHGGVNVLLLRNLESSTSPHASEAEVREAAQDRAQFNVVLDNREGTAADNFARLVDELRWLGEKRRIDVAFRSHEDREP